MLDAANRPQILEHTSRSLNITIYDTRWIPCSARFAVLGSFPRGTGSLQAPSIPSRSGLSGFQVFELDDADVKLLSETEKPSPLKCGTFGASSLETRHLATGDFSGVLSLWDLDRPSCALSEVGAHKGTINGLDGLGGKRDSHGPPEIATCGRDGCVRVHDVRDLGQPVAAFEPNPAAASRECWSVAFGNAPNDAERCLLAGYDNGDVKLFDLRLNKVRWETNVKNGVCGVQFDRREIAMNKFVVACLESELHVFDARTHHPTKALPPGGFAKLTETTAFRSTCWTAQHLPQNREIWMVTHGDGTTALYKYHYPPQRKRQVLSSELISASGGAAAQAADGKFEGVAGTVSCLSHCNLSSQPISGFDWSPDREGLFVCGALDQCVRVGIVTKLKTA